MEFKALTNPQICSSSIIQVSTEVAAPALAAPAQAISLQDQQRLPYGLLRAPIHRQKQYLAREYCLQEALRTLKSHATRRLQVTTPTLWSTTKTQNFASAAVSLEGTLRFLGIDSERIFTEEASQRLWTLILTKRELAFYQWHAKQHLSRNQYLSLVFSAKQSIFKAADCFEYQQLRHQDISVEPDLSTKRDFYFCCHRGRLKGVFNRSESRGRYDFCYQHVHTAIEI